MLEEPSGVQLELTEPVALLLDEPPDVERVAAAHGFRFFTSVAALREYVEREVLQGEARAAQIRGVPRVGWPSRRVTPPTTVTSRVAVSSPAWIIPASRGAPAPTS